MYRWLHTIVKKNRKKERIFNIWHVLSYSCGMACITVYLRMTCCFAEFCSLRVRLELLLLLLLLLLLFLNRCYGAAPEKRNKAIFKHSIREG